MLAQNRYRHRKRCRQTDGRTDTVAIHENCAKHLEKLLTSTKTDTNVTL